MDWDDALEQHPLARRLIFQGHLRVERWLKHRAQAVPLTLDVVEGFHRTLFSGVFPEFSGRLRGPSPQYIPMDVEFGGKFRGVARENVADECSSLFATVGGFIRELDEFQRTWERDDFLEEVLKAAAYTHCEVIRIHPFRNGNGRIARTCLNYFARRYGNPVITFDRPGPDSEYLQANRSWLYYRNIHHFMDFLRPSWKGGASS